MDTQTGGKVALGCGSVLLLLSLAMSAFFLFHLVVDPGGAISDSEAEPGVAGGVLCFLFSVTLTAVGAFFSFRSGASAGTPGPVGTAGPSAPSNGPTIGVGCGALFALMIACLASGGVPYFSSEVSRWERMRDEDRRNYADPLILMIDEHAIEEANTNMSLSAGCAGCSGLFGLLGIGGAVGLYFRSRRAA